MTCSAREALKEITRYTGCPRTDLEHNIYSTADRALKAHDCMPKSLGEQAREALIQLAVEPWSWHNRGQNVRGLHCKLCDSTWRQEQKNPKHSDSCVLAALDEALGGRE